MNKKKASAAIAAVMNYIKTQEEALAYAASEIKIKEPEEQPPQPPVMILQPAPQPVNIWGLSGRQAQMQANSMMQLRMFK